MSINKIQPRHWVAIGLGLVSAVILVSLMFDGEASARFKKPSEPPVLRSTGTVKDGQVLAGILKDHDIDPRSIYKIQKSLNTEYDLRAMKPGHRYEIVTSTWGEFRRFIYKTTPKSFYKVVRSSMGVYSCSQEEKKTVWLEKRVSCKVSKFLNYDLKQKGLSDRFVENLTVALSDQIFAWRIDFFTEQRVGDELDVLLEEEYVVGSDKPIGGSLRILAAYYKGSGTKDEDNYAIRYQAEGDKKAEYFDIDGKAVRKVFLRAPFKLGNFRISSHFNKRRFHPIKRVYRPHHGTDYAASRGTPIAAIGRGQITFAGWKGGYGKTIQIRHNKRYKSLYAHLSKIRVKKGQFVEQGQYIGNVGTTGVSTGPHLHFEMHVDGRQENFLRLNFPSGKPISAKDLPAFEIIRDQYLARLNNHDKLAAATSR